MRGFALACILAAAGIAAGAQGFSGTYRIERDGAEAALRLAQESGGRVSGTLTQGPIPLQIEGRILAGRVVGKASIAGTPVSFGMTIARTGDKLILELTETGDDGKPDPELTERFVFPAPNSGPSPAPKNPVKPAGKKPAGKTGSKPKAAASGPAASTAASTSGWKTLRHPYGLSLQYPKEWTLQEDQLGFLLLPRGVRKGGDEVYVVSGIRANGVTDVADPRVEQTANAIVQRIGPLLKRTGSAQPAGKGLVLTWANQAARGRMYLVILKDYLIGITALGTKSKVDSRDPILRKILATFRSGAGELDQRLVGTWSLLRTTSIDARNNLGQSTASSVSDTQRTLFFRPDGTVTSREVSRTIALGAGVSLDSGDQVTTKQGKWYAGSGRVTLMWEQGTAEDLKYQVQGGQLIVDLGNGRAQVWQTR